MNGCAVGISAAIEQARWGAWDEDVTMAPRNYSRAVQEAGGLVFLLPPDDVAEAAPERWLERIDALILSGGNDIDPAFSRSGAASGDEGDSSRARPLRDRVGAGGGGAQDAAAGHLPRDGTAQRRPRRRPDPGPR